jgi:hypothetical protein
MPLVLEWVLDVIDNDTSIPSGLRIALRQRILDRVNRELEEIPMMEDPNPEGFPEGAFASEGH